LTFAVSSKSALVTGKCAQRAAATFKAHNVSRTRHARVNASRTRTVRVKAASSGNISDAPEVCAWRGDLPPQGSLPLKADGTPDYTSIDASPISKVLTATIRKLLVKEVGEDVDKRPWTNFDALLTSVRSVNDMDGTAKDVQVRAQRVFAGILPALGIGWVIPLWKKALDPVFPQWFSNYAFVLVFTTLFPWLMGPMKGVDEVDVPVPAALRKVFKNLPETFSVPQAVKAERCRFLESTQCASVCVNTCKVPSQNWLFQDFGMKLHIQPNYDDFSCQWKFNVEPPPLAEDEAVMVPCFAKCDSEVKGQKDAFRQLARADSGFGMVDGVDKYTGETLEQIVARATAEAKADAARGLTPDGTAGSAETLKLRAAETKKSGKCWSVDEERLDKYKAIMDADQA